jgi:hypothetical protein
LWGINIYPGLDADERIEFDSMISLRPGQGKNLNIIKRNLKIRAGIKI